ncbi:MAG: lytic murein transglycosylase [Candidatus Pacebacteria bacterium]|nr:lytic murein transglycosylase [Candidatus Paceibacterota bacterium]
MRTNLRILLFFKRAFISALVLNFIFGLGGFSPVFASQSEEERAQLEAQLTQLEAQIDEYQKTVDQYRTQGNSLSGEIKKLDTKIAQINLQIKAVNLTLQKLDYEIGSTQKEIVSTESEIDKNKRILSNALQSIYANENLGMMEIIFQKPQLSDFFNDLNNLMDIQDNIKVSLDKIIELRKDLVDKKEQLVIKKTDTASLKNYQLSQKTSLSGTKVEKDSLLKVTKGQESKYQELVKETQKTAAQIRSRIFEMLGGGEMTFEEAYKFAKFAEQSTGVRAALILAVLDRESALGQNVGRCNYKTAMHPTRDIPIFLALCSELGLNPESMMVSCANKDGAYGGAMGPSQFIPSTWKMYRDRVQSITGSNPPSPWRNGDAFVATGLYLKDAGAKTNERIAAAKYYCGGSWNRYTCTNVYGRAVVEHAKQFQADIDVLNS